MTYKIITLSQRQMTATVNLPDAEPPLDLVAMMNAQIERDIERAFYGDPPPSTETAPPPKRKPERHVWTITMDCAT